MLQYFSTTISEPMKERLVDEMGRVLHDYINPETQCLGNGLINVLGGMVDPPLKEYVDKVVCAAAALGTERVVQLLTEWSDGKPVSYERKVVLIGGSVEGYIELKQEGISIDRLPASSDQLTSILPYTLQFDVPVVAILGLPLLSVDCSVGPVFYMPTGKMDEVFHREWAHGRLPEFSIEAFCEALSLTANGCIRPSYEWSHAPDLGLLTFGSGGSMWRSGDLYSRHRTLLTQQHLEEARDLYLMRSRLSNKSRRSLDVSIHRWIKSKGEISTHDQLIELRIALEALYLKGVDNELSFRMAALGAWHLGDNREERNRKFEILRNAYRLASKVIHASKTRDTIDDQNKVLGDGQDVCREGILKVLREGEPNWDGLIFGPS